MTDIRLTRFLLVAMAVFFACALFTSSASAATYCQTDEQCPERTTCIDNRCTLESSTRSAPVDPGADEECSTDRRCRIRRLARKNRARRQIQAIREEQALESLIERTQHRREQAVNRHAKPWTLDLAASGEHEAGLMGGYAFTPHIKAEASFYWPTQSLYTTVGDVSVEGVHDYTMISVGPTYYFSESTISPYVRGAFMYGTGEFRPYGYGGEYVDLETETHALSLGAGVDVQFEIGFHVRLGANYRMLLFNEASIQTGEYNDVARKALEDKFFPADLVFLIGWAL